jgi:GT2 family glycosyltransferase
MVQKIGALDERFFMYCEDVDLCRRATDTGWNVLFFPGAVVTHRIGTSSDKSAERMIWEFHKSWLLYVEKHYPGQPLRHFLVKSGLWLRAYIRILNRRRHGAK